MSAMAKLLEFLERLDELGIAFSLKHIRYDTVMVLAHVPGQYWEVEFFEDGHVEIEVYQRRGDIEGEEALPELFDVEGTGEWRSNS
jgi:hypothetical protein